MKYELIKTTREVGTSAGVILPRKLLGATVKITVLEEAPNPLLDSLKILENHKLAQEILGMYLVGSYARGENKLHSDIDVLVVTQNTTKTINEGRYSLTLVSMKDLEQSLKDNLIYYLPMIKEAKTLLNNNLIETFKDLKIGEKHIRRILMETQKAIVKIRKMIELDSKLGNCNTGDSVSYSLILRLKSLYIVGKLKKGILWSNKEFERLVSSKIYERYLYVKNENKVLSKTPLKEAQQMLKLLEEEVKKW